MTDTQFKILGVYSSGKESIKKPHFLLETLIDLLLWFISMVSKNVMIVIGFAQIAILERFGKIQL